MAHYFTSDPHFNHKNILKYCSSTRPWVTVGEMNEAIISCYNETARYDDDLWILGDVGFGDVDEVISILKRIKAKKHLIIGNHDKKNLKNDSFRACFVSIDNIQEINVNISGVDKLIIMCHFKMAVWNKSHRGSWHLFGHSHGTMPDDTSLSMDVGIDAVKRPISLLEISDVMSKKQIKI